MRFFETASVPDANGNPEKSGRVIDSVSSAEREQIVQDYSKEKLGGGDGQETFTKYNLDEDSISVLKVIYTVATYAALWEKTGGQPNETLADFTVRVLKELDPSEIVSLLLVLSKNTYEFFKESE